MKINPSNRNDPMNEYAAQMSVLNGFIMPLLIAAPIHL